MVKALGAQGDGVADGPEGPVYIPFTVPGERVRVEVRGERGRLMSVLDPSPARRAAPCAHYGVCGGCVLQHLEEETYRVWKRNRVVEALRKRGLHDVPVDDPVISPDRSRRRARLAAVKTAAGWRIGFHGRASARVEPIEECLILDPRISAALSPLREGLSHLPDGVRKTSLHVTASDDGLDIDLDVDEDALAPKVQFDLISAAEAMGAARLTLRGETTAAFRTPRVRLGDTPVPLPAAGFLQATEEGEATLQSLVREGAAGARRVADLFAGCGTFSLVLARTAAVAAVESDRAALAALEAAARGASGLKPITTARRDLFQRPLTARELSRFDAVVFDPPRAGAKAQAAEIAASDVPRVVAVSCDPGTFARDARILVDGGYALTRVAPVDQFVYASHIECVGFFERRS